MRTYDFKLAKHTIQKYSDLLEEAELGILEDWNYTSMIIYENKEFVINLDDEDQLLHGINGSVWATPVIKLTFKDGEQVKLNCYTGESSEDMPEWFDSTIFDVLRQSCLDDLSKN